MIVGQSDVFEKVFGIIVSTADRWSDIPGRQRAFGRHGAEPGLR